MIWIKTEEENKIVTNFYLEIIGQAFKQLNQEVFYSSNISEISPNSGDIVVVSTSTSARKFMRRDIKLIYWAQGAWPEESYLRHKSKMRFAVTSWVEKTTLKRADFVFFVSDSMREHFRKKYKLDFDNYYIMPCANECFHENSFDTPDKYQNNVFCYAGATSLWQCFEETIELYSRIEREFPESKLLLLVKDRELAINLLTKYGVKNYEIDFVSINQLPDRLSNVKYGFILRKPSVINTVATPTKTLTYLSNGIIPIYSECLVGISEILKSSVYKVEIREGKELKSVINSVVKSVDKEKILDDYKNIYKNYYDKEMHIERISDTFKKIGVI